MEEYDRNMRDSVNAFYQHAVNDPSMSREEAIAQTSQMAERYLEEREALQEAYERGEIASENGTATNLSGNETGAQAGDPLTGTGNENSAAGGTENGAANDNGAGEDNGSSIGDDDGGIE